MNISSTWSYLCIWDRCSQSETMAAVRETFKRGYSSGTFSNRNLYRQSGNVKSSLQKSGYWKHWFDQLLTCYLRVSMIWKLSTCEGWTLLSKDQKYIEAFEMWTCGATEECWEFLGRNTRQTRSTQRAHTSAERQHNSIAEWFLQCKLPMPLWSESLLFR